MHRLPQTASPSGADRADDLGGVRGVAAEARSLCRQVRWIPRGAGIRLEDCDIIETENDSWRFKSRTDDHTQTRARAVSATPTSSDGASATARTHRSRGSKLDADVVCTPWGGQMGKVRIG